MDGETSGDRLVASFERWAASERAAEHAAARARTAWLARQSASSATWTGVLLDLAEQGAPVVVTLGPIRLTGRLVGLGRDFCVLEQPNQRPTVIALAALTTVAPAGGKSGPGGQRSPSLSLGFSSVLEALMEDRAPLVVHPWAGPAIDGELIAVGEDMLTVRTTEPPRRPIHVPLGAVAYCELR